MKHIFVTYGDDGYEFAKARIAKEAFQTGEFDIILTYGRESLSKELLASKIIQEKRGGGLWSWKPDILLTTMNQFDEGDIIVYCDAGCSLYPSREWNKIWRILDKHDIISQRIFQRTDKWTRRELIDEFIETNGSWWPKCYQYQATIILKITPFTRLLVGEWRDMMINKPMLSMDVAETERSLQSKDFIENRHDQAVYSALIYKYKRKKTTTDKIYTQWEHIEDIDIIRPQAIRATRYRKMQVSKQGKDIHWVIKRMIKDYFLKPFYYIPLQWWYSKKNKS